MAFIITTVSPSATYELNQSHVNIDEGDQITLTLNTTGVQNGHQIPYTITGDVDTTDFTTLSSLSGNLTVQNSSATAILTVTDDAITEGVEAFTFSLSTGQSTDVYISDPTIAVPTSQRSSYTTAIVDGNVQITITFTTESVTDGEVIDGTVAGVSDTSLLPAELVIPFTVTDNIATGVITLIVTEPTGDVPFTITFDDPYDPININIDTSAVTPAAEYYLGVTSNEDFVMDGLDLTVILDTVNIPDNTTVPFTISGPAVDGLDPSSMNGVLTITSNYAEAVVPGCEAIAARDRNLSLTITLDNGLASYTLLVGDIIGAPEYYLSYNVINGISDPGYVGPAYEIGETDDGGYIEVILETVNVLNDTILPYSVTGNGVTSEDFDITLGSDIVGTFVTNNNIASIRLYPKADTTTEGDTVVDNLYNAPFTDIEDIIITLDGIEQDGYEVSTTVAVGDTSTAGPVSFVMSYGNITSAVIDQDGYATMSPNNTINVTEGTTIDITVTSRNVADGTVVGYTVNNYDTGIVLSNPEYSNQGTFIIMNNTATFQITVLNDNLTEGETEYTVTINDFRGYEGELNLRIIVNDTSTSRFNISASPSAIITEGDTVTLTLSAPDTPDGTSIPYDITGVTTDDITILEDGHPIPGLNGEFYVVNGTAEISVVSNNIGTTEATKLMYITLYGGGASANVQILDAIDPVPLSVVSAGYQETWNVIDNPLPSVQDYFGDKNRIAISGGYVVVGAPVELDSAGVAYIFDTASGMLLHTLTTPATAGIADGGMFGSVVDILGNLVAVGAPHVHNNEGRVYLYNTSGVLTGELIAPETSSGFGAHIDITPNYISVRANLKVYVYNTTTLDHVSTITDTNGITITSTGNYVAVHDVLSGYSNGTEVWRNGLIHMCDAVTGAKLYTLQGSDGFGERMCASGNYLLVGVPDTGQPFALHSTGKVMKFHISSGLLVGSINNPDNIPGINDTIGFGEFVAVSGDEAVVGSLNGMCYRVDINTGDLIEVLNSPVVPGASPSTTGFGRSGDISGNYAVIGSPLYNTTSDQHVGRAYVYMRGSYM